MDSSILGDRSRFPEFMIILSSHLSWMAFDVIMGTLRQSKCIHHPINANGFHHFLEIVSTWNFVPCSKRTSSSSSVIKECVFVIEAYLMRKYI